MTAGRATGEQLSRGDLILQRAAALISDRGFGETSMRELAAASDMSLAGLYHYFSSKNAILGAVIDQAVDHLVEALRDAVASSDGPEERVRAIVRALVKTTVEHREAVHTLFENIGKLEPEHQRRVRARQHEATVLLRSELHTLRRRGLLADVDVSVAVFSLIGMTNWTHFWFSPDGRCTADEVAAEMADIFLRGILR